MVFVSNYRKIVSFPAFEFKCAYHVDRQLQIVFLRHFLSLIRKVSDVYFIPLPPPKKRNNVVENTHTQEVPAQPEIKKRGD